MPATGTPMDNDITIRRLGLCLDLAIFLVRMTAPKRLAFPLGRIPGRKAINALPSFLIRFLWKSLLQVERISFGECVHTKVKWIRTANGLDVFVPPCSGIRLPPTQEPNAVGTDLQNTVAASETMLVICRNRKLGDAHAIGAQNGTFQLLREELREGLVVRRLLQPKRV